jgi:hypothetical protein
MLIAAKNLKPTICGLKYHIVDAICNAIRWPDLGDTFYSPMLFFLDLFNIFASN